MGPAVVRWGGQHRASLGGRWTVHLMSLTQRTAGPGILGAAGFGRRNRTAQKERTHCIFIKEFISLKKTKQQWFDLDTAALWHIRGNIQRFRAAREQKPESSGKTSRMELFLFIIVKISLKKKKKENLWILEGLLFSRYQQPRSSSNWEHLLLIYYKNDLVMDWGKTSRFFFLGVSFPPKES